jgi:hypothetical protein
MACPHSWTSDRANYSDATCKRNRDCEESAYTAVLPEKELKWQLDALTKAAGSWNSEIELVKGAACCVSQHAQRRRKSGDVHSTEESEIDSPQGTGEGLVIGARHQAPDSPGRFKEWTKSTTVGSLSRISDFAGYE